MAKRKCPMCGKTSGEIDSINKRTLYLYCDTCLPIVKRMIVNEECHVYINERSGESPYVLDRYR